MGMTSSPVRMRFALSAQRPVMVLHNRHNAAQPAAFDLHYELELGIVLRGVMRRIDHRGTTVDCRPGDLWFCGMWEPHGYHAVSDTCEVVVFVVWPPAVAGFEAPEAPGLDWMGPFKAPLERKPRLDPRARRSAQRLGRELTAFAGLQRELEPPTLARIRIGLMHCIALALTGTGAATTTPGSSVGWNRLAPALDLALATRKDVPVARAAQACHLSSDRFARLFTALMGTSFHQFVLRQRLHGVALQLTATDDAIKAVAHEWGFVDSSHLTRHFQAHYGCSPNRYRTAATSTARTSPPLRPV
jgi:AraC-like DNA-binding protein